MTDDDREPFEPEAIDSQDDQAGDPAQAFEALRETVEDLASDLSREMTTIRKGVEAAFDRFEAFGPPTDYSADLGRLVQGLAVVGERLKAIEVSPILKNGPEHHTRVLERSGESLVRTAAQQLERQAADIERAGNRLAAYTKSAYDRRSQDIRMWTAGGFGLVFGVFLILILPRFLPFSTDSHVASLVMGRDRVGAGYAMIEAAEPFTIEKIRWSLQFFDGGGREFSACLERAKQTRREQKCAVTVPAPKDAGP